MKLVDLKGKTFVRLTVLDKLPKQHKETMWLCQCECGGTAKVKTRSLTSGHTRSCGCLMREIARNARLVHGGKGTTEYNSWRSMRDRCNNPNHPAYRNYGGRGIAICDRWNDFALFLADMGNKPTMEHTLDRINNDGSYEPTNCRWATVTEQNNNKRTNRVSA